MHEAAQRGVGLTIELKLIAAKDFSRLRFSITKVGIREQPVGAVQLREVVGFEVLRVDLRVGAPQPVATAGLVEVRLHRPTSQ